MSAKSKFPALWDLKMKRRLESLFDRGGTLIEAAREMGVSRSTLNKWINSVDKQKESFRETVKIGKEASEAWWIRQGRENLETRGFNHGLWLMNMVNRFGWTSSHSNKEERKEIEHTVEVKKKVDVDAILDKAIKKGVEEIEKTIH